MATGAYLLLGTPGSGGTPPASPVLTVADNADGTGAVATVTGSTSGSANTVYVAPWSGSAASLVFTAFGPRTSDGTVALSLTPGGYVGYIGSTLSSFLSTSNFLPFSTTNGSAYMSTHAALAHAVQATIQGMIGGALTGIVADSVRTRLSPSVIDFSSLASTPAGVHAFPCIIVAYFDRERIPPADGTNLRDDIHYPITLVLGKAATAQDGTNLEFPNDDPFLYWRESLISQFINQPYHVTANGIKRDFSRAVIEPGPIVSWDRFQKDAKLVGGFTAYFKLRRTRGIPIT